MDYISYNNRLYFESAKMYPQDHRGVKWGSAASQFLRFKVLCDIAPNILTSRILDVGCGLGHLVDYLITQNFQGTYKGLDLVGEMVLNAQKRHPSYHFEVNDIDSIPLLKSPLPPFCKGGEVMYDYVLASGIFAFSDWAHTTKMIEALFQRAKKGVAFNCLSTLEAERDPYLSYYDPMQVFDFCKTITPEVTMRADYLPNDFTVYLRRVT